MGCLDVILKAILIITNVVVLVAGLAMLVLGGIYLNKDFDFYPELADYSTNMETVLIPMMVLGGLLLIVGMIGCIGACTGKAGLLNVYFIVVLIVVVLEVALIILCVVKKDDVRDVAIDAADTLFSEYKDNYVHDNATETMSDENALAVNTFMSVVGCCGLVDGPVYWRKDEIVTIGNIKVPPGCCTEWSGENVDDKLVDCSDSMGESYENGCTEEVDSILSEFSVVIIVVVAAVVIFQLLCMCAACYSKKNDMVA